MADLSDVERALVSLIATALFPAPASYLPGAAAATFAGPLARVYRGWPNAVELDAYLKAKPPVSQVTVFSRPGMTRLTTRYPRTPTVVSAPPCTLLAAAEGPVVTFSGEPAPGQLVGVSYARQAWVYPVLASDDLADVAAGLAALVPGASSAGPVLTLATAAPVIARTSMSAGVLTENRRQEQGFLVTFRCPDSPTRDALVSAVDAAFAAADFLALPDGSAAGPLLYAGTGVSDVPEKAHEWRRDLSVKLEYPTTQLQQVARTMFGLEVVSIDAGPAVTTIA